MIIKSLMEAENNRTKTTLLAIAGIELVGILPLVSQGILQTFPEVPLGLGTLPKSMVTAEGN